MWPQALSLGTTGFQGMMMGGCCRWSDKKKASTSVGRSVAHRCVRAFAFLVLFDAPGCRRRAAGGVGRREGGRHDSRCQFNRLSSVTNTKSVDFQSAWDYAETSSTWRQLPRPPRVGIARHPSSLYFWFWITCRRYLATFFHVSL